MPPESTESSLRLDRYVAGTTDLSRRQVRQAVRAGRVLVDGEVATEVARHVSPQARVLLDGRPLRQPGHRYFMLHKPPGYVCASHDPVHPVALDLLDEDNAGALHFAGRLDIDATGLVLITDDGQWSHRIRSPRHGCEKTYYVELEQPLPERAEEQLARGIWLQPERHRTRPARLERVADDCARLTLTEGRYHQVKRMFAALGCPVEVLHREAIGGVELDAELLPGEYRPLTADEVARLTG